MEMEQTERKEEDIAFAMENLWRKKDPGIQCGYFNYTRMRCCPLRRLHHFQFSIKFSPPIAGIVHCVDLLS